MDFSSIEKKWQERWAKERAFEPSVDETKKKFFITVPYPYISGSLHIGHGRAVTEADVFARYQRMRGLNVLYPMAFHISGTPVLGISMAIKQGDQKKIDLYTEYVKTYVQDQKEVTRIVKSFEEPQAIVDFFIPKMMQEFGAMGLGIDWRRRFSSGDFSHQRLVEWQFRQYEKHSYLMRGKYPVLYSIGMENAVGEDDIQDGDTHPVEKQEFTLIKFKAKHNGEDVFIVAATLRPETMYGQTNMWANPGVMYQKIVATRGGKTETWLVSKECAEKLAFQDWKIEMKETVEGRSLLGTMCFAPYVEREIPVLPSIHCDPDIGTGFVTSVPSDAPYDHIALKELQDDEGLCRRHGLDPALVKRIRMISIITSIGYGEHPAKEICERMNIQKIEQTTLLEKATQELYKAGYHTGILNKNCGPHAGMKTEEAKEKMRAELLKRSKAAVFHETSRKATDRSGAKIIVAILDNQWFLDFNAKGWKEKAKACLDGMTIQPNKYRKEFEDAFSWLDKRPCARQRGLGTRLPQDPAWVIESLSDSTLYMTLYTFADVLREAKIDAEKLDDSFFDYVFLKKGSAKIVSKKTGIPEKTIEHCRTAFAYWYPNDHRHTYAAHLTNHLSFSIFAHAGLLPKSTWPQKYSFHGMVISQGQKMSKSKGNVISLLSVKNSIGADSFRALVCTSTSVEGTFNWDDAEAQRTMKQVETLFSLLSDMRMSTAFSYDKLSSRGKAFISQFERSIVTVTTALDEMDLRVYATTVLYGLMNQYRRIKQLQPDELLNIHARLKPAWLKMLSPLIPHIAEELHESLDNELACTMAWPKAEQKHIDENMETGIELVEEVRSDILSLKELTKTEPKTIRLIVAHAWKHDFAKAFANAIQESRDFKTVLNACMADGLKKHGQEIAQLVPKYLKDPGKLPNRIIGQDQENAILQEARPALEKEFNARVEVLNAETSQDQKAKSAMPGKPGIMFS